MDASDELVERAARIIEPELFDTPAFLGGPPSRTLDKYWETRRQRLFARVRAALAAIPDARKAVIEECAKVADNIADECNIAMKRAEIAYRIADSIRALKSPPKDGSAT